MLLGFHQFLPISSHFVWNVSIFIRRVHEQEVELIIKSRFISVRLMRSVVKMKSALPMPQQRRC